MQFVKYNIDTCPLGISRGVGESGTGCTTTDSYSHVLACDLSFVLLGDRSSEIVPPCLEPYRRATTLLVLNHIMVAIPDHSSQLLVSLPADHVLLLTLNRPRSLNAMTPEMTEDLNRILDWFEEEEELWSVYERTRPRFLADLLLLPTGLSSLLARAVSSARGPISSRELLKPR